MDEYRSRLVHVRLRIRNMSISSRPPHVQQLARTTIPGFYLVMKRHYTPNNRYGCVAEFYLRNHQRRAQCFMGMQKLCHTPGFLDLFRFPTQGFTRLVRTTRQEKFLSRLGMNKTQHGPSSLALWWFGEKKLFERKRKRLTR